jgi:hypothetical protein
MPNEDNHRSRLALAMEERAEGCTLLAEQRVHARPESGEEAKAALAWIAAHEGKTLVQLAAELHVSGPLARGGAA